MAEYIAYQIYMGKMNYDVAVEAHPELKEEIDQYIEKFENQNL